MILDEAIERYISNAEYERTHGNLQGCLEFIQLADWLKELKQLKQSNLDEKIEDYENEIEGLQNRLDIATYDKERLREEVTNLETKIKELQSNSDEDCISRKAVEDITWQDPSYSDALNTLTEVREKVRALPSIQPKAKVGHWVLDTKNKVAEYYKCSKCGRLISLLSVDNKTLKDYPYCHCGAKMEEEG